MTAAIFYKVLAPGGRPHHGGTGTWHRPNGARPGKWMPKVTPVVPCRSGYHLCTIDQLAGWLGPEIWVAEGRGEHVDHTDKHVYEQARLLHRLDEWNDRTARLFAADCAEHVLAIYEKQYSDDRRPRDAIAVARLFATGQATAQERAAAGDAAGDAARAAAWAAAWAAARDAAWAAAWDAAWNAAWAAAWAAAMDAAWAAARDAAWNAAWAAAGDAAGAAAGDAARATAGDAARATARAWQTERLTHYLNGGAS